MLQQVIRPEDLAPPVGSFFQEDSLPSAFGLDEPLRDGHVGGHLFFFVVEPGAFKAPDRLARPAPGRPAETAFVLTRSAEAEAWRYCGVARWRADEDLWELPELDWHTWNALGSGRSASRRLEDRFRIEASALVDRVLSAAAQTDGWIRNEDRKLRVIAKAPEGGLRIDGGPGGFAERTVSLVDLGWVAAAADYSRQHGVLLDEALVNRLRYIDGTPKGSTRWIDTGHALALRRVGGSE